MIYSDKSLSQILERTEARANAHFVEAHARLDPELGAEWIEVAGAYAMFDGVDSPLTQTFGLGVFETTTAAHLDRIEAFYAERGAPVFHEISPMADASLLTLLGDRGYRPIELTSVMYREISGNEVFSDLVANVSTRRINEDEADLWAQVAADGWASEAPELRDFILQMGQISARTKGADSFLAEIDGRPIAAAGFFIHDDICILAGASTLPNERRQGAQNALLNARLRYAAEKGCTKAILCAAPGSQSQKNGQKNGFNIAYTRIKWQLAEYPGNGA